MVDQGNLSGVFGQAVPSAVKGFIRNLILPPGNPSSTMAFMFRPGSVQDSLTPSYDESASLGMSHPFSTYASTGVMTWTFELFQNALMAIKVAGADANRSTASEVAARNAQRHWWNQEGRTPASFRGSPEGGDAQLAEVAQRMEEDRRFLISLAYPALSDVGVTEAPPAVILCLPGVCTARCRLASYAGSYERVDIKGRLVQWKANVAFKEVPLGRITMEDVLLNGTFRTWGE